MVEAQNKLLNSPARKLQLAEFAIANLYVDDVDEDKLVEDAIIKMLEELEALCPGQFLQPYRGYVVNLDAIRTIASDRLVLRNGDSILIKRGDFRRLREKFFEWSFRSTEEAAQ